MSIEQKPACPDCGTAVDVKTANDLAGFVGTDWGDKLRKMFDLDDCCFCDRCKHWFDKQIGSRAIEESECPISSLELSKALLERVKPTVDQVKARLASKKGKQ
jgi:hypothetical protein